MKPKAVVTNWVHPEVIRYLEEHFAVAHNAEKAPLSQSVTLERAADAEALMVFMPDSIDDEFLECCPRLKIVSAALKGYDNFDVDACTRRNIWFTIVPDLLTEPTAELAVGLMIGLARNIPAGDGHVRSGDFRGWRPHLYGTGLAESRVGIIGIGAVGTAIAQRLSGFGCSMAYTDPVKLSHEAEHHFSLASVSLEELLGTSDYVVVAAPLNDATIHLICDETIALMKPESFLINIGRGSVVDELAVVKALKSDRIAGYAADVFEMEDWARSDRPRSIPSELLEMTDRTLFTPHLGSAVHAVRFNIALQAARNMVDAIEGRTPAGAINRIG